MRSKVDNKHLDAKLELRRYMLRRYHASAESAAVVMDCCAGDGLIWRALRAESGREFSVRSVFSVDVKPKPGRLAIRSERLLELGNFRETNVIDVDTYGAPWAHWLALLPNVVRPTTVFLTCGSVMFGRAGCELAALGIRFSVAVPGALGKRLGRLGERAMLSLAREHGLDIHEIVISPKATGARYYAVHISR